MSVRTLLEAEKKALQLRRRINKSLLKQREEIALEIKKLEYVLADRDQVLEWRRKPADAERIKKLNNLLDDVQRLYRQEPESEWAQHLKIRKQLEKRLTNLRANELEVKLRADRFKAETADDILSSMTDIRQETAIREMYEQMSGEYRGEKDVKFYAANFGRAYLKDLVTLETKAAGSKMIGEYMSNLYNLYEDKLKDVYVSGIVRGDNFQQMHSNLMKATDITAGKAKILINTESNAIMNQTVKDVMENNPLVKGYRFRAVLDSRTSSICQQHDGKYIPKEDVVFGVNYPPLHPNCRSTVTTVLITEDEKKDEFQRYTKGQDNKWIALPPGTTYKDYKEHILRTVNRAPEQLTPKRQTSIKIPTLRNLDSIIESKYHELHGKGIDPYRAETYSKINGMVKKVVDNSAFKLRVSDFSSLENILKEGVRTPLEMASPNARKDLANLSKALFGTSKDTADIDYEIYGYLGDKDFIADVDSEEFWKLKSQGDIAITLKKDNLKERTTMTLTETSQMIEYSTDVPVAPTRVDDLSMSYIPEHLEAELQHRVRAQDKKPKAEYSVKDLYLGDEQKYVELQYHGGIEPKDIERVDIRLSEDMYVIRTPELFDLCKKHGIELNFYHSEDKDNRIVDMNDYDEFRTDKVESINDFRTYREFVYKIYGQNYMAPNKETKKIPTASEIPSLKNHSEVEKTELRERFIASKMSEEEWNKTKNNFSTIMKNLFRRNTYRARVPSHEVLESIVLDRFKNQLETQTSGGVLNPSVRRRVSNYLFGTDMEADPKAYEVYGYLGAKDFAKDIEVSPRVNQYGYFSIEFKDKTVKDRTTFTIGDSLDTAFAGNSSVPSRVSSPTIAALPSYEMEVVDRYASYDIKELPEMADLDEFFYDFEGAYVELQFHGGIDATDIAAIDIQVVWGEPRLSDDFLMKCEENNIPINFYKSYKKLEQLPGGMTSDDYVIAYEKVATVRTPGEYDDIYEDLYKS